MHLERPQSHFQSVSFKHMTGLTGFSSATAATVDNADTIETGL